MSKYTYVNEYSTKIRKACLSCKYSVDGDLNGQYKRCTLDKDLKKRDFLCEVWEPEERYKFIGGPYTSTGNRVVLGQVKRKAYLQWVAQNNPIRHMMPTQLQHEFKKEFPAIDIYYSEYEL